MATQSKTHKPQSETVEDYAAGMATRIMRQGGFIGNVECHRVTWRGRVATAHLTATVGTVTVPYRATFPGNGKPARIRRVYLKGESKT